MNCLQSTNNQFIYSKSKLGGLGLVAAYDDYLIQNVVHALRLLTSLDIPFRTLVQSDLLRVAKNRIHLGDHPMNATLTWLNNLTPVTKTNPSRTWWSKVRTSVAVLYSKYRIRCTFHYIRGEFVVTVSTNGDDELINQFGFPNRDDTTKFLHDAIAMSYFAKWKSFVSQGRIVDCFSRSKRSNKILTDIHLPDRQFQFLVKARSNNLQLKYRPFRLIKDKSTKCRHCGYGAESQAHVLNH